jgi:predicted RNA binding protein YcfA (HicA-like mRNA interferase family)
MSKLPAIRGSQVINALKKINFQIVRQKGSHIRLRHNDGRVVTIPIHSEKTIGKGFLLKSYETLKSPARS